MNVSFKSSVEVDFFRHTKERINHQQACTISSVKIHLLGRKKKKKPHGNWDQHKEMKSTVDINYVGKYERYLNACLKYHDLNIFSDFFQTDKIFVHIFLLLWFSMAKT